MYVYVACSVCKQRGAGKACNIPGWSLYDFPYASYIMHGDHGFIAAFWCSQERGKSAAQWFATLRPWLVNCGSATLSLEGCPQQVICELSYS
jgi:hypothetical protein